MIEYNGKQYVLRYSQRRIEMIESATKSPIMQILIQRGSMFSLAELKSYYSYGLMEQGAETYVPLSEAAKIAEAIVTNNGYASVLAEITEALNGDCPFFFQAP